MDDFLEAAFWPGIVSGLPVTLEGTAIDSDKPPD
jgi:hypothetical protein